MRGIRLTFIIAGAVLLGFSAAYFFVLPHLGEASEARPVSNVAGDAERGRYFVRAAGCLGCHTDHTNEGEPFAGGPALKTNFGTFYAPNITPDPTHGIGGWNLAQFSRALADGLSPSGEHYFPVFPYTSYTKLTPQDVADLKAYLDSLPAVVTPSRPHEVSWPFSDRRFLGFWKLLNFDPGVFQSDPSGTKVVNRGAYLVQGPGHCAECHTQRNFLGGLSGAPLAGNGQGPGGVSVPAIDVLYRHRGQPWTKEDLIFSLQTGLMPNGDTFDGTMGEFVEHGSSYLTDEDVSAIADYLFSSEGPK